LGFVADWAGEEPMVIGLPTTACVALSMTETVPAVLLSTKI
jgi:hypothetical protein